ncbi:hypothetical protein Q7P37_003742 [Cladosporium fusiforme]
MGPVYDTILRRVLLIHFVTILEHASELLSTRIYFDLGAILDAARRRPTATYDLAALVYCALRSFGQKPTQCSMDGFESHPAKFENNMLPDRTQFESHWLTVWRDTPQIEILDWPSWKALDVCVATHDIPDCLKGDDPLEGENEFQVDVWVECPTLVLTDGAFALPQYYGMRVVGHNEKSPFLGAYLIDSKGELYKQIQSCLQGISQHENVELSSSLMCTAGSGLRRGLFKAVLVFYGANEPGYLNDALVSRQKLLGPEKSVACDLNTPLLLSHQSVISARTGMSASH